MDLSQNKRRLAFPLSVFPLDRWSSVASRCSSHYHADSLFLPPPPPPNYKVIKNDYVGFTNFVIGRPGAQTTMMLWFPKRGPKKLPPMRIKANDAYFETSPLFF